MVEHQPSKLVTWVRFPSPALATIPVDSVFTGVFLCQNSWIILNYPKMERIFSSSQAFEILFIVMSCHVKSLFVDGEARDSVGHRP